MTNKIGLDKKIIPIREGFFTMPSESGQRSHLLGSRCKTCSQISFPPRAVCSNCFSEEIEGIPLSTNGKLYTYTIRATREAYEISGIGPEDLDLIELNDCFTIAEIFHYENLGLCKKGEEGRFIDEGKTELNGKIPVNPSVGLLA